MCKKVGLWVWYVCIHSVQRASVMASSCEKKLDCWFAHACHSQLCSVNERDEEEDGCEDLHMLRSSVLHFLVYIWLEVLLSVLLFLARFACPVGRVCIHVSTSPQPHSLSAFDGWRFQSSLLFGFCAEESQRMAACAVAIQLSLYAGSASVLSTIDFVVYCTTSPRVGRNLS